MSRKNQIAAFLRQQAGNRIEQANLASKGHSPNAQQIGHFREAARMFTDAAEIVDKFDGPVTVTSEQSYRTEITAQREKEVAEAKEPVEKAKVVAEAKPRKKWTRKAIEESKSGPAIAKNDKD